MKTASLKYVLAASFALYAAGAMAQSTNVHVPIGAPGSEEDIQFAMSQREARMGIFSLPFVISTPGSYFLTGSLVCTNNANGITIQCDDVKLDLNGFSLIGRAGMTSVGSGIHVQSSAGGVHNITIRNGVIREWPGYAISCGIAHDSEIDGMKAYNNGAGGIVIGENAIVNACTAYGNGYSNTNGPPDDGIRAGPFSTVESCKSRNNKGTGIYVSSGSRVIGCTASQNNANGIFAEDFCTVRDCLVKANKNGGISILSKCRVQDNMSCDNTNQFNTARGIMIQGTSSRIENNTSSGNNFGFFVADGTGGNLVICNSASGNSVADYRWGNGGSADAYGDILDNSRTGAAFTNSNPWSNFRL